MPDGWLSVNDLVPLHGICFPLLHSYARSKSFLAMNSNSEAPDMEYDKNPPHLIHQVLGLEILLQGKAILPNNPSCYGMAILYFGFYLFSQIAHNNELVKRYLKQFIHRLLVLFAEKRLVTSDATFTPTVAEYLFACTCPDAKETLNTYRGWQVPWRQVPHMATSLNLLRGNVCLTSEHILQSAYNQCTDPDSTLLSFLTEKYLFKLDTLASTDDEASFNVFDRLYTLLWTSNINVRCKELLTSIIADQTKLGILDCATDRGVTFEILRAQGTKAILYHIAHTIKASTKPELSTPKNVTETYEKKDGAIVIEQAVVFRVKHVPNCLALSGCPNRSESDARMHPPGSEHRIRVCLDAEHPNRTLVRMDSFNLGRHKQGNDGTMATLIINYDPVTFDFNPVTNMTCVDYVYCKRAPAAKS